MKNNAPGMMDADQLSKVMDRTRQLHRAVAELTSEASPIAEDRFVLAFQAGVVSVEHAIGAHLLLTHTVFAPGFSLYRPQFETLVRGVWLLHAASDGWVEKLLQPLTLDSAKRANQMPLLAEMLRQLDKSDAPGHLVQQLTQFREVLWKDLSSFTHGGIHPMSRTIEGYPPEIVIGAICNSNALVTIAAQLISIVTSDPPTAEPVRQLVDDFADCIPLI